jgi:hypothetical protein
MTSLAPRQHDVIRRNHVYLNLPTASERAEILRKAEKKREREGPPKYVMLILWDLGRVRVLMYVSRPVSLGRKTLRYPGQAVEFGMRGGGGGFGG